MDRAVFTRLAETTHGRAEDNMRAQGYVAPMMMLFDRFAGMSICPMLGECDDHMISQLRKVVRSIGAVAAIRISEGLALSVSAGASLLPFDDLPRPSESPDAQRQIITEARWPWGGIHQVRATDVEELDGALVLRRVPGDPDQSTMRNDLLAGLFPPVRHR